MECYNFFRNNHLRQIAQNVFIFYLSISINVKVLCKIAWVLLNLQINKMKGGFALSLAQNILIQ